jgi:hypothetical protein
MAGPTKPHDEAKVGQVVQTNYQFLEKLFDTKEHQALRNRLFDCADEAALRLELSTEGLQVVAPIRILLVDIENARTKTHGGPIKPTEDWYVLVLPPVPRRELENVYKRMQAWSGANYHASSDSYGM